MIQVKISLVGLVKISYARTTTRQLGTYIDY